SAAVPFSRGTNSVSNISSNVMGPWLYQNDGGRDREDAVIARSEATKQSRAITTRTWDCFIAPLLAMNQSLIALVPRLRLGTSGSPGSAWRRQSLPSL